MHLPARLAGLAAALGLLVPGAVATIPPTDAHIQEAPIMTDSSQEHPGVQSFHLDEVREDRAAHGRPWQEFLRVPELFAGLYEIPAGGEDPQGPHDADEVYHVLSGRAVLMVEDEPHPVRAGSVIYVAKELDHRFVEITEDLSVLVFFATPPGEG